MDWPPLFEEFPSDTAEDFLTKLSPLEAMWSGTGGFWDQNGPGARRNWVFRGQASASWPLTPSAMRPGALIYYSIGGKHAETPATLKKQLQAELDEVSRFVRRCIRAALPLPEDSQWFRNGDLTRAVFGSAMREAFWKGIDVPFPLERSLVALAQHHGVPTRLLDWSESPLVAAYFACRQVAEGEKKQRALEYEASLRARRIDPTAALPAKPRDGKIAVWALRQLAFQYIAGARHTMSFDPTLEAVEAPFESNPNLRAQRGLFTLVRFHTAREESDFKLPSIEEIIARCEDDPKIHQGTGPWLRRLTLPHTQAPMLLRLLDQFNVNAATIYPSYDGVVQSIREREFFE